MKKQPVQLPELPIDVFFFVIPIENKHMLLHKESLYKYYDPYPKSRRLPLWMRAEILSLSREIFHVKVHFRGEVDQHLFIHIEPDEVHVACNCGMQAQVLCRHAYYGILYLMHDRDLNLKPYYWPGYGDEVNGVPKYLDVTTYGFSISIEPKQEYGNLYRAGIGFTGVKNLNFDRQLNAPVVVDRGGSSVLGFALLYMPFAYHKRHLPFLLPFTATLNKKGNDIAGYRHYLKKDKLFDYEKKLTDNQIMLGEIGNDMFNIAKAVGKPDVNGFSLRWQEAAATLLSLWKKIIPKLNQEEYFRACFSGGFPNRNDKPRKTDMMKCSFYADRLSLNFLLSEHEEYFTLEYMLYANGKNITAFVRKDPLFVVDTVNSDFYLVSTMQDENLLNFFDNDKNRFTILKIHFIDFYERFLSKMIVCYSVFYLRHKTKKQVPFEFPTVMKDVQLIS